MLNALPAFRFECIQPQALLFLARSVFGTVVTAKSEEIALNDDVNVFGESLDEFPRFGERRAAFESEMRSPFGKLKQFAQRPANPIIFFHADGVKAEAGLCFIAKAVAAVGWKLGKRLHGLFF